MAISESRKTKQIARTNRRSGSETISIRPVPALLRSILEVRVRGLYVDLAVSCTHCQDGARKLTDAKVLVRAGSVLYELSLVESWVYVD